MRRALLSAPLWKSPPFDPDRLLIMPPTRAAVPLALAASLTAPAGSAAGGEAGAAAAPVTVIYSSGLPVEAMYQQNHPDPDALTSPTPADSSVKVVVTELADELQKRGITARLVPVAEVTSHRELLASPVLVLAGSSHFGRADWGLKKLLDERVGAFLVSGQGERLAGVRIYALGHSEGGVEFSGNPVNGVREALRPMKIELAGEFRTVNSANWTAAQRAEAVAAAAETLAAAVLETGSPGGSAGGGAGR